MTASNGQVAIVTGAGHGIGRASAERLARDGYGVAIAEIDSDRAGLTLASDRGNGGVAIATDVSDPASVEAMVSAVVERHGRLDVLSIMPGSDTRCGCMSWGWTTGIACSKRRCRPCFTGYERRLRT